MQRAFIACEGFDEFFDFGARVGIGQHKAKRKILTRLAAKLILFGGKRAYMEMILYRTDAMRTTNVTMTHKTKLTVGSTRRTKSAT